MDKLIDRYPKLAWFALALLCLATGTFIFLLHEIRILLLGAA